MNPFEKNQMLKIIDGQPTLVKVMHDLTRYKDCHKFLRWLIINNITGKNLVSWLKENFGDSTLAMINFICKKQHNKDYRVLHGRDWN